MRETEFDQFSAMLDDVASLLKPQEPLTATARAMFFRALSQLSLPQARSALDAHVRDPQRGRFFPKPADLFAQLESRSDGRPGADEAWATAVRSMDEDTTIVWTTETSLAWGLARPVMQLGDEVGARVAFRDAYNRLVSEARRGAEPVEWQTSLGHDVEGRAPAIREAVALGLLGHSGDMPALEAPRRGDEGLASLLDAKGMPPEVRAKLLAIRERIAGADSTAERLSQDAEDKLHTAALIGESNRKVEQYARERGIE